MQEAHFAQISLKLAELKLEAPHTPGPHTPRAASVAPGHRLANADEGAKIPPERENGSVPKALHLDQSRAWKAVATRLLRLLAAICGRRSCGRAIASDCNRSCSGALEIASDCLSRRVERLRLRCLRKR